jgi:hypothetical protein
MSVRQRVNEKAGARPAPASEIEESLLAYGAVVTACGWMKMVLWGGIFLLLM